MWEQILQENSNKMHDTVKRAEIEINKINTNLANPSILADVMVEYYGSPMPILQLARINVLDGKQIFIKPYDIKLIANITSAIIKKNLGLNPQQNADSIIIKVPQLTEDKRRDIVKKLQVITENHKVLIRNIRRNINQMLKKDKNISKNQQLSFEEQIQKTTDECIKKISSISTEKEKKILTV